MRWRERRCVNGGRVAVAGPQAASRAGIDCVFGPLLAAAAVAICLPPPAAPGPAAAAVGGGAGDAGAGRGTAGPWAAAEGVDGVAGEGREAGGGERRVLLEYLVPAAGEIGRAHV